MIDLKDLRDNPDKYRRGDQLKGVKADVDAILRLDERHRSAQREFEQLRSEQNQLSQQIGKSKDAAGREALKAKAAEFKPRMKDAEDRARAVRAEMERLLLQVPQPPDDDVPPGKDASENVVVRKWGEPRRFEFKPKSHIELGEGLGILDFKAGGGAGGGGGC